MIGVYGLLVIDSFWQRLSQGVKAEIYFAVFLLLACENSDPS